MGLRGATEIHLYSSDNSKEQSDDAAKWLKDSAVDFVELRYNDSAQHLDVLAAINSWFPTMKIENFPFVVYSEAYEDLDPKLSPKKCIYGLDAILNSNLAELAALYKAS